MEWFEQPIGVFGASAGSVLSAEAKDANSGTIYHGGSGNEIIKSIEVGCKSLDVTKSIDVTVARV